MYQFTPTPYERALLDEEAGLANSGNASSSRSISMARATISQAPTPGAPRTKVDLGLVTARNVWSSPVTTYAADTCQADCVSSVSAAPGAVTSWLDSMYSLIRPNEYR